MTADELTQHLRYRVLGLLHSSRVTPGERLPSIRETSAALDADHRAVAEAYRRLEAEGLVEIRPSSGVFVAEAKELEPGVTSATHAWIEDFFLSGWHRGESRRSASERVERCAASPLHCACVESVEDHMVALKAELERDFDLKVEELYLSEEAGEPRGPAEQARVVSRLREADFAVALRFHGVELERLANEAEIPLVVVSINAEFASAIDRLLAEGPVTGVVTDPRMLKRIESYLGVTAHKDAVHTHLASEFSSLSDAECEDRPVLATRAARRALGAEDFHLIPDPPTLISPETARAILKLIIEFSLVNPG